MGRSFGAAVLTMAMLVVACSGDDDTRSADGEAAPVAPTTSTPTAVPSAGCEAGAALPEANLVEASLDVRGAARRYLLSAPATEAGADPLPLVLDFHGLAEGADIHAQMTQLGPLGVEEGFITVFPHGRGTPVGWDVHPDAAANDDLAYVAALLDRIEQERCVDPSRVYATGLSYGAMMSSTVACAMADRVAAVAPVAGLLLPEPCDPVRPVPVLTIHGTADPILQFNGGIGTEVLGAALGGGQPVPTPTTTPADLDGPGYPETVRDWAALDGCDVGSAHDERVSDEVIRRIFDCPEEALVEFLIVEGGGHSWPGSAFSKAIERVVGPTTDELDASEEIWSFFTGHALPAASG